MSACPALYERLARTTPLNAALSPPGPTPPCSCSPPWPPPYARLRAPGCLATNCQVRGLASLRALLRNSREQGAYFCLPVPAVSAERTYGSQLPGLGPPCDGFRVNPEHGRYLCWGQQRLGLWRACRHVDGLSSWTGTAILRFLCLAPLTGSIEEPAVDVPYGLLRPYCHHHR
jgi:hypothetical protein